MKIIKTIYGSPQSSTRGLALQVEKDLRLRVSHETIRKPQEWLRKKEKATAVSTKCRKEIPIFYRTRFTSSGVNG